ncbi:MAG: DUF3194 domain-containing protein [Candidatus Helarchaeota archaeon]
MIIEIGLPTLNEEQLERLCEVADNEIKKFIFSKVAKSKVTVLENSIEINHENDICKIDIELNLEIQSLDNSEVEKLANETIQKAFESIENELKK